MPNTTANASENSESRDVPPGYLSGVYYIVISNVRRTLLRADLYNYLRPVPKLEFGTTWQQLKDFVRSVCVVEHVEVFRASTTAWVCVHGQENFEKAWGV